MTESRTIEEQLAEFSKIVDDLENIDVRLEDKDKVVILLNALPRTFEHFRDALLYGKDQVITLEEVVTSIRTKEFQKLQDSKATEVEASELVTVKGKGKKQGGKLEEAKTRRYKTGEMFQVPEDWTYQEVLPREGQSRSVTRNC
ncbi:hypothetical protein VIGAN_08289200 [Vigna angularis var. angularis]|uniref:Retrovirus-related Pol polyprotein from transposon TNT 1-94 n=1 Tax=Vigna angularis var. angularis TaxID=157739 RepID=A0A0S3ST54_PHAAN|nr:hypothetical protein VIGAN_08289200 [Vigna angularis var. angularis]